jgi:nucleoprotein TPR
MSAEIEQLKQELSVTRKALENAKAAVAALSSADPITEDAKSEQVTTLTAEIDQREAKLKELEQVLVQREAEVTRREASSDKLKEKANRMLRERQEKHQEELSKIKAEHEAELERVQQAPQAAPIMPAVVLSNDSTSESVTVEGLPDETATDAVVRDFINKNVTAKSILRHNIARVSKTITDQLNAAKEDNVKLKTEAETIQAEMERLRAQGQTTAPVKPETEPQQDTSEDMEAALAKVKADAAAAIMKEKEMCAQKMKVKESMVGAVKAKWNAITAIAKATPTEEVGKAVEEANKAKPPPAAPPAQPAQPATVSVAAQLPQNQAQQHEAAQLNGATVAQLNNNQQPNPFIPPGQNIAPNPFMPAQQGRGLAQPGFTGHSQPQFQPHQQGGRGRGENHGTGPRALQSLMPNPPSNLPRGGGSGIPMPGGRGRGQQQQQQNSNQPPNINTQLQSQIGRGGGNRGGTRGNGRQNQGSPRTSLNPGVVPFQPGPGAGPGAQAGRGQKRSAEDEGEGAARGGKRGRGGRGGGQGGE